MEAIYLDTLPIGRAYFFLLNVDGSKTMIETAGVAQITDLE